MGLLKLLGISTKYEGSHAPGKHEKGKQKPPRKPKKGNK